MTARSEAVVKWGLVIFGSVTLIMMGAVIAPSAVLEATFGTTVSDPLALMIVRSWGALIGLMGALLITAAWHPGQRFGSVLVVMVSKIVFLGLLVLYGQMYLRAAAGTIVIDMAAIVFLAWCLFRPKIRA